MLKFDSERLFKDIVDEVIIPSANQAIERTYKEIIGNMGSNSKINEKAKKDIEVLSASLDDSIGVITASLLEKGWALLESFGTSDKMDLFNEELTSYVRGRLWNKLRDSYTVVGRKKGTYTDFFGETQTSEGTRAGKSLGGWSKGISPSYTIQNAEIKLKAGLEENGFVMRILRDRLDDFLSRTDLDKYFDDGR